MRMTWNEIRIGCAAVGARLGWFIGGFDNLLYALLTFVCLDYITGVLCACRERQLSSEIGFIGICRKVLLLCSSVWPIRWMKQCSAPVAHYGPPPSCSTCPTRTFHCGKCRTDGTSHTGSAAGSIEAATEITEEHILLACWSLTTLAGLFYVLGSNSSLFYRLQI